MLTCSNASVSQMTYQYYHKLPKQLESVEKEVRLVKKRLRELIEKKMAENQLKLEQELAGISKAKEKMKTKFGSTSKECKFDSNR